MSSEDPVAVAAFSIPAVAFREPFLCALVAFPASLSNLVLGFFFLHSLFVSTPPLPAVVRLYLQVFSPAGRALAYTP